MKALVVVVLIFLNASAFGNGIHNGTFVDKTPSEVNWTRIPIPVAASNDGILKHPSQIVLGAFGLLTVASVSILALSAVKYWQATKDDGYQALPLDELGTIAASSALFPVITESSERNSGLRFWKRLRKVSGFSTLANFLATAFFATVDILLNGFEMHLVETRVSDAPVPENFTMIFASDPQLVWGKWDNTNVTTDEFLKWGLETNRYQVQVMNHLKELDSRLGDPVGIVMNGDLTAFGHPWQWDLFKRFYIKGSPDAYHESMRWDLYPGLGNHDYALNVDDCMGPWESIFTWNKDWCAYNSVKYIDAFVAKNKKVITNFDPKSRAYSWDVNSFHFIQLHFHPLYEHADIGVESSWDWLKEDLRQAAQKNLNVVINFHDLGEYFQAFPEFLELLDLAKVAAIFTGHIHRLAGLMHRFTTSKGRIVPHFRCGSSTYNLFLAVNFSPKGFEVFTIDASEGHPDLRYVSQWPL